MTLTYSSVSFWAVLDFLIKHFLKIPIIRTWAFHSSFFFLFLWSGFIFTSPFIQSIAHHPSSLSWHVTSSKRSCLTSTDIPLYQTRFISHATQTICFCNILYLLFYSFFGGYNHFCNVCFFLCKAELSMRDDFHVHLTLHCLSTCSNAGHIVQTQYLLTKRFGNCWKETWYLVAYQEIQRCLISYKK